MKVDTVEQFKVLKFIKENFHMDYITLELIDRYTIEVEDRTGEKMKFQYKDGKVVEGGVTK